MDVPEGISLLKHLVFRPDDQNQPGRMLIVAKQEAGVRSLLIDPGFYKRDRPSYTRYDLWMPETYFVINAFGLSYFGDTRTLSPHPSRTTHVATAYFGVNDIDFIDTHASTFIAEDSVLQHLNTNQNPFHNASYQRFTCFSSLGNHRFIQRFNLDDIQSDIDREERDIYLITPPLTNISPGGYVCNPGQKPTHPYLPENVDNITDPAVISAAIDALNSFWETPFVNDDPGAIDDNSSACQPMYAAAGLDDSYPEAHVLTAMLDFWENAHPQEILTLMRTHPENND